MSSDASRDELVAAVLRVIRKGASQTALFSQAVAERLGLAGTDVECLDVLLVEGRLTVGRLAELTGLTTGSATRMVDRLFQDLELAAPDRERLRETVRLSMLFHDVGHPPMSHVSERVMPGAVSIDHGARYDPIVPGEFDRGGAINTITPHNRTSKNATGMVCSSFLVEVEKVTEAQMNEWKAQYPDAFNRAYDPAQGLCLAGWLEGEEL